MKIRVQRDTKQESSDREIKQKERNYKTRVPVFPKEHPARPPSQIGFLYLFSHLIRASYFFFTLIERNAAWRLALPIEHTLLPAIRRSGKGSLSLFLSARDKTW